MQLQTQKQCDQSWAVRAIDKQHDSGPEAMKKLLNSEISIIALKKMIPDDYLQHLTDQIYSQRDKIEKKQYVNGALTTFGPYLAKYLSSVEDYFNAASMTDILFKSTDDLRETVRNDLCRIFNFKSLTVAKEKNGNYYSPAVVRIHGDGVFNPLHNDNIMRDAQHAPLILKDLAVQLSCIVCIQECDAGGELQHYRKRWQHADEKYKIPDGLGYYEEVVDGVDSCLFKPETGDVYIIDPRHYHEIHKVMGKDRITLGFFFGFFEDNLEAGVVWS